MKEEEITQLELKLAEIDGKISALIQQRWELVNPDPEEVWFAIECLRDDSLNTLADLLDGEVGRWLIPDEVLCQRRLDEEDRNDVHG